MIYEVSKTPPTVNSMYAMNRRSGGKDRRRSPQYDTWLALAIQEIKGKVKPIHDAPYALIIHVSDKARGDVDGYIKGCVDLLVKLGATPDDRKMFVVTAKKSPIKGVRIEVLQ